MTIFGQSYNVLNNSVMCLCCAMDRLGGYTTGFHQNSNNLKNVIPTVVKFPIKELETDTVCSKNPVPIDLKYSHLVNSNDLINTLLKIGGPLTDT